EIRMATVMVTANSLNSRPNTPPRNSTGMKTAARDNVIETMVNPISPEPFKEACSGRSPFSMWRTMFSSITMASSTTKPMARIRAIMDRLSSVYPNTYITAKVPTSENGRARLGMTVAEKFLRNRKITITTRPSVRAMVNWMSRNEFLIDCEPSYRILRWTEGGSWAMIVGSNFLIASAMATALTPGWRWMARIIDRSALWP